MSLHHLIDTGAVVKGMAALAWFGKVERYNATRDRLLDLTTDINDATKAEEVTEACCLLPVDAARRAATVALGQRSVVLNTAPASLAWKRLALGMAEYRGGQFANARNTLTAATEVKPENKTVRDIAAFYHAMSLFRLGKADEAWALALDAARTMPPLPTDNDQVFGHDPYDLIVWLAYKKAKALIGFENPPPPKPAAPPEKK